MTDVRSLLGVLTALALCFALLWHRLNWVASRAVAAAPLDRDSNGTRASGKTRVVLMRNDDGVTVYWPRDIRANHGHLYGWISEDSLTICVVLARSAIVRLALLSIIGNLSIGGANSLGPLSADSCLPRPVFSSDSNVSRVVLFTPPNTRRKAFLSVDGVAADLESVRHRLNVSDHVDRIVKSDFTAPNTGPSSLKWAIERINEVHKARRGQMSVPTGGVGAAAPPTMPGNGSNRLLPLLMRSAVVRQAVVRYRLLLHRQGESSGQIGAQVSYIRSLWIIANDIIVGSALATLLHDNADVLAGRIGIVLSRYVIAGARDSLNALNENPGGLKLNAELGDFFCDAFLWFLSTWDEIFLANLIHYLPFVIRCVALSAYLGSTFALSAMSDLVALASLHLFVFHFMTASIYRAHANLLYALFNVFRGKKYNTLRNRVEPSSYELDQLLIGTILFTLAIFLFPTVFVYHVVCAAFRAGSVLVQAVLEVGLTFVNHFPLFAIMLRIKEPGRLPGGLRFKVLRVHPDAGKTQYLQLENRPISFSRIFSDQRRYIWNVLGYYSKLPKKVASGRILLPFAKA